MQKVCYMLFLISRAIIYAFEIFLDKFSIIITLKKFTHLIILYVICAYAFFILYICNICTHIPMRSFFTILISVNLLLLQFLYLLCSTMLV